MFNFFHCYTDIPEGCLIIREHVPISNLFGCLWFNEVDRFTSRDQISFSTVRDKIRQKTNWTVHMFLDCERRNFVVQVSILFSANPFSFIVSFCGKERVLSGLVVGLAPGRGVAQVESILGYAYHGSRTEEVDAILI